MKAELETGEIITLEKDCECITHNGPHWVYANDMWKRINLDGEITSSLAAVGRAQEEIARLNDLEHHFRRLRIARLIREDCDELTDIQKQRVKEHFARIAKEAEARIEARTPKTEQERRQEHRRRKEEVQLKARHSL